jgi:hypothetical protein
MYCPNFQNVLVSSVGMAACPAGWPPPPALASQASGASPASPAAGVAPSNPAPPHGQGGEGSPPYPEMGGALPEGVKLSQFLEVTNQLEKLELLREWVIREWDSEASARPGEQLPVFANYWEATRYVKANGLVLLPSQHSLNLGRYKERGVAVRWWHRLGWVWDPTGTVRQSVGHRGVQFCPTKETFMCVPGFEVGPTTPPSLALTTKVAEVRNCSAQ